MVLFWGGTAIKLARDIGDLADRVQEHFGLKSFGIESTVIKLIRLVKTIRDTRQLIGTTLGDRTNQVFKVEPALDEMGG